MTDLYFSNQCSIRVSIYAQEMNNSINETLKKKIKLMVEGKCIREGFVKPGSVDIVKKSMGTMMMNQFNGDILYNVTYKCDICDPKEGMLIKCNVININKMGIVAKDTDEVLNILVAKEHHIDDDNFSTIKENDAIQISVIGVRKEFGDKQISIIGKLVYDVPKKVEESPKPPTPEPELNNTSSDSDSSISDNIIVPLKFTNKSKIYRFLTTYNTDNEFIYKGVLYKTIEHAYQAQKSDDKTYRNLFNPKSDTYIGDDGAIAKKTAAKTNMKKMKVDIINDWSKTNLDILEAVAREFFEQHDQFKSKLKATEPRPLEYINKNYTQILMKLRSEF